MATDAAADLQLVKLGMPKETFAMIALLYTSLEVVVPLVVSRWLSGGNSRPLSIYISAYPLRICTGLLIAALIHWTPRVVSPESLSIYFYVCLIVILIANCIARNTMFVAQMAFFARISDPTIGGTYMTMLNTVANLGGMWPGPLAMLLIGFIDQEMCTVPTEFKQFSDTFPTCQGKSGWKECQDIGGYCVQIYDGFAILTILCSSIGIFWFLAANKYVKQLESEDIEKWRVQK